MIGLVGLCCKPQPLVIIIYYHYYPKPHCYLVDDCRLVADVRVRLLRSADTRTLECQLDVPQFRRQDLRSCWNQSVEQFAARPETTGTVIRPVQAVNEDIFIWTVRPRNSLFVVRTQ